MQPAVQTGGLATQLANSMQMGNSPLNVQTPGSPNYNPSLVTQQPTPMPQGSPASDFTPTQMQQGQPMQPQTQEPQLTLPVEDSNPQAQGTQVSVSEAEKIIAALEGRLKNIGSVEKMTAQAALPQQPTGGV